MSLKRLNPGMPVKHEGRHRYQKDGYKKAEIVKKAIESTKSCTKAQSDALFDTKTWSIFAMESESFFKEGSPPIYHLLF